MRRRALKAFDDRSHMLAMTDDLHAHAINLERHSARSIVTGRSRSVDDARLQG